MLMGLCFLLNFFVCVCGQRGGGGGGGGELV